LNIQELSNKTESNPLIIHINPIGLVRMGSNNEDIFLNLNSVLNEIQDCNGNVAIPVYSYSYAKNEIFDVINTPSNLDKVSEFLRIRNKSKRTIDSNFSYLLFGKNFLSSHFRVSDYSSFGEGSLIDEVYNKDGYLGAIGGALEYLTEIHFLERKLNMPYRFNKDFYGISIDSNGNKVKNKITYYCRDLESDYSVSFVQLKKDIRAGGLVQVWDIVEFNFKIEVVKIRELFKFIEKKLLIDHKYLWKNNNE
jgi:aminoglycoside N3'-acetyltransferase